MRSRKVYKSVADLPPVFVPVKKVEKNFGREAAEADRRYGPHVPPLVPRGRPRKGVKVEKSATHSVRMPKFVLGAARVRARSLGITTNAAIQLAVIEWTDR